MDQIFKALSQIRFKLENVIMPSFLDTFLTLLSYSVKYTISTHHF